MKKNRISKRTGESGSALMIVMIMAAVVAIMLYQELPVAAFEAQREKEQRLIDGSHEYTQAVRLYLRRIGSYPPSLDALEDTNRIRFLRRRFKDPLTGQPNWRLLHTGVGGVLIDSKLKTSMTKENGQNTSESNTKGGDITASSVIADFNQSSSDNSDSASRETIAKPIRQRPPIIPANATAVVNESSTRIQSLDNSPDPATSLLPVASTESVNGETQSAAASPVISQPILGQFGPGIAGVASRAEGHSIKAIGEQTDYSLWEFYYDPLKDPMRLSLGFQQNPWAAQTAAGSPGTKGAPGTGISANPITPLQKP